MYGQTVRGNSPFWYEYGQSGRRNVVIGKILTLFGTVPAGCFVRIMNW